MARSSIRARLIETLFHQKGEPDPEVRRLSLATLNDDDLLSTVALLWTQFGWGWVIAASGRSWPVALMAIDLFFYASRLRLRRGLAPFGLGRRTGDAYLPAWINMGWFALIALEIYALCQLPSDRTAIFGLVLVAGCSGYICALFAAFPVLAGAHIVLLNLATMVGLATGFSDVTRPFAVLCIGIAAGFLLLLRRTHASLLGAIRAQRESHVLAMHDPLTKLPNRAFMREKLGALLESLGKRNGARALAVLCLDLDGFKQVNDRYGHAAGDRVLIHVAGILRRTLRPQDIASRIGGDEYVIVLPDATEERARSVAQAVVAELTQPIDIGRTMPAFVGGSIGGAVADAAAKGLDELLGEADAALYVAKRSGKGRFHLGPAGATRQAGTHRAGRFDEPLRDAGTAGDGQAAA